MTEASQSAHTAFISHAADDAAVAMELCRHLEDAGIRCWIAPRDVTPGRDYAAEILDGIEASATFVLILSAKGNASPFVHREVERATSKDKPIFPVRIENVLPDRELELFVSSAHWIDAWDEPRRPHWERLARAIKGEHADPGREPRSDTGDGTSGRRNIAWVASVGAIVAAILLGSWIVRGTLPGASPAPQANVAPTPLPSGVPAEAAPAAPSGTPASPRTTSAGGDTIGPCPERFSISAELPSPFTCRCGSDSTHIGSVWGSDLYTDDSGLCQAAVHAGVIPVGGGQVTVERRPGRELYVGTRRNGISTNDYGAYGTSMHFVGTPEPAEPGPCPTRLSITPDLATPYSCTCSAENVSDGTVWGTDLYTSDSNLCRAALHAGVLSRAGGTISVETAPGRPLYVGSPRNGVATHDYGPYGASIRFR